VLQIFQKFDEWLISSIFERFTQWFQEMFGHNCFWLARLCMTIWCLLDVMMMLFGVRWYFHPESEMNFTSFAISCIFSVLIVLFYFKMAYSAEKKAREALRKQLSNPEKREWVLRLILFWLSIFTVYYIGFIPDLIAAIFSLNMFFGLIACDQLPPSKSKVREWFESLGKTPIPIRVSNK